MNIKIFAATAAVLIALPFAASAQGVVGGGAAGAVGGGIAGLLGVDQQPRFHAYVQGSIVARTLMTGLWPWALSFLAKA